MPLAFHLGFSPAHRVGIIDCLLEFLHGFFCLPSLFLLYGTADHDQAATGNKAEQAKPGEHAQGNFPDDPVSALLLWRSAWSPVGFGPELDVRQIAQFRFLPVHVSP
ncbi:hypothetical protein [Stenotrophomonas sp. NLF4-10]|uniref:hypothetical protein n=1 Tax=Stenotrophomonas sp. NLF4-10 TaxID=2918754 RepID=UPI001EFAF7E7|nr:hypothetical protein [Stenotrophomonas sp. NLF4-10]MCG8276625.1 hypothetical protein [Stenotrophomonas sp. NLF4-10]